MSIRMLKTSSAVGAAIRLLLTPLVGAEGPIIKADVSDARCK